MSTFRNASPDNSNARPGLTGFLSRIFASKQQRNHPRGQFSKSDYGGQVARSSGSRAPILTATRKRLLFGLPLGIILVAGALSAGLSAVREAEVVTYDNAIWLDKSWTIGEVSGNRLSDYADRLRQNQIGTIYAYASTLDIEGNWTGGPQGDGEFLQSRDALASFVSEFKKRHPDARMLAWIEIWTHLDPVDAYRLDDLALHENVANFSRQLVDDLDFDGIMLDVKPLYKESDDFLRLIRSVRSATGLDIPIAVSVSADLTPLEPGLQTLRNIAPGTMWSANFKQRVMVSADEVVILMYQSYRRDMLDYINWIAHQVTTYVSLLETDTRIVASIPNYSWESAAHDPVIETLDAALDGVKLGVSRLSEDQQALMSGVAIFTDKELDQAIWNVYRDKWLQR